MNFLIFCKFLIIFYRTNVLRVSKMFKDRPMTPVDTAIYWIEFIHRHGKDAMKSPIVNMTWWQTSLLDVYTFVAFSSLTILCIVAKVCKILIELSKLKFYSTFDRKMKSD